MTQRLAAPTALAEMQVQFPAHTWQLTSICNLSPRRIQCPPPALLAPGTHINTHTYMWAKYSPYTENNKNKENKATFY